MLPSSCTAAFMRVHGLSLGVAVLAVLALWAVGATVSAALGACAIVAWVRLRWGPVRTAWATAHATAPEPLSPAQRRRIRQAAHAVARLD